jgi:transcription elongation factor
VTAWRDAAGEQVTAGRHEGDTGMVVAVEEGVATLFTDITQEEVRVFTRDLTECVEEATGQTTFGPYELHDLVALDPSTVGLIVKVSCTAADNRSMHLCRPVMTIPQRPPVDRLKRERGKTFLSNARRTWRCMPVV